LDHQIVQAAATYSLADHLAKGPDPGIRAVPTTA